MDSTLLKSVGILRVLDKSLSCICEGVTISVKHKPTEPEFIHHVPKAVGVVPPVPEELCFPTLASEEYLGSGNIVKTEDGAFGLTR